MTDRSPYQFEEADRHDPFHQPPVPPVWQWYVVYCIVMGVLYLLMGVAFGIFLAFADEFADEDPQELMMLKIQSVVMLVVAVPFALLYFVAPFLPKKKFAWIYGFVTIGLGLTSPCCMPASIPLLIFWLKDETKHFFGVS